MNGGTIQGTRPTGTREYRCCDRCGGEFDRLTKPGTKHCESCVSVMRIGSGRRAIARVRELAISEGWDADNPHLGPWGKAGAGG